jgi:hypothetical protein
MIKNDINIFYVINMFFELLNWFSALFCDFFPGFVDVLNFVHIQQARISSELLPNLITEFSQFSFSQLAKFTQSNWKSTQITRYPTSKEPWDPFQADSDINDLNWELLQGAVPEALELHEDHVSDFQPINEVFHAGTQVATPSPAVRGQCDLIEVETDFFQPLKVEFDDSILPVDFLV